MRCASSSWQRSCRSRTRSARSHFHGAGRSDPLRLHGYRSDSPRYFLDISEHSICQPGRPWHHGDSQNGSPSFFGFQRTKSVGSSLPSSPVTLNLTEAGLQIVQIFMGQFSVLFKGFGAEINRAVSCHIRMSFFDQRIDHLDHTADLLSCLRILRRRFDVHHLPYLFCTLRYSAWRSSPHPRPPRWLS